MATTAVLRSATSEISWVTPRAPTETLRALCDLLVRSGSRVLLTGHGGDATMGNDVECTSLIADCIVEHHPLVAIGLAHDLARATRMTLWNVLAQTVAQLRPVESRVALAMSRILRTLALTPGRSHEFEDVFLLRRSYRALWEAEIRRQVYQVAPYPLPSVRHILASLFYFADTRGLQAPSEFIPVLTTHPYLDRRLVEYILAIPYSVLCSPGKPRAAMRLAFAPFVPARILGRVSKGYAAPFIVHNIRALTSDWLHNLDSLEIVRRGLVEEERLATRLRALDSGAVTGLGTLSTMLSTELWLQQITRRLASAA